MIWSENWKDSGSITTHIACTLRSTAHRQKSLPKLPAAMLTSADSSGNLIAVGYISYPWQLEQQFAMHRNLPLFYCVNFKTQVEKLSESLARDVNLFAMRSLNGVISDWSVKNDFVPSVIDIYKNEIARIAPRGPLALGGNCQGGVIAEALARSLLDEGRDVVLLALLEHEPSSPYPGRVSMFFHTESLEHTPFHQRPDPESEWREMHADVTWDLLPEGHGRTFNKSNFPLFSTMLVDRLQQACAPDTGNQ